MTDSALFRHVSIDIEGGQGPSQAENARGILAGEFALGIDGASVTLKRTARSAHKNANGRVGCTREAVPSVFGGRDAAPFDAIYILDIVDLQSIGELSGERIQNLLARGVGRSDRRPTPRRDPGGARRGIHPAARCRTLRRAELDDAGACFEDNPDCAGWPDLTAERLEQIRRWHDEWRDAETKQGGRVEAETAADDERQRAPM